VCHAGHDLKFLGYGRAYCDCGANNCELSVTSKKYASNCLKNRVNMEINLEKLNLDDYENNDDKNIKDLDSGEVYDQNKKSCLNNGNSMNSGINIGLDENGRIQGIFMYERIFIYVYMHAYLYMCICVYIFVYMYVFMLLCIYVYRYVYVFMYKYIFIRIYMYIYIYMVKLRIYTNIFVSSYIAYAHKVAFV
jgi:hypothetical protein